MRMPTQAVFHGQIDPNMRSILQFMWEEIARVVNFNGSSVIIVDKTHAQRLADYSASDYPLGTGFLEQDRGVLYVNSTVTGANTWVYVAGGMYDLLANRPTDLDINSRGFRFVNSDTDQNTLYIWSGIEWLTVSYLSEVLDATTNAAVTLQILRHLCTGTVANGFGIKRIFQLEDAGGTTEDAAGEFVTWTVAAHATRTSDWAIWLVNSAAALAKAFRVLANGGVELIGKIIRYNNAAPTNGQLLIGNTGGETFDAATLTGTANQVIVTNGAGTITLSGPQDLGTGSSPTFNNLVISSQLQTPEVITAVNVDLALSPQGTGVVKFGTHSAVGAEVVTGYITIKDAGGTVRKLAVIS